MLPLKDKRILSFETWGSGAYHAELLAFLGAEVINIEDPAQNGNPLRSMGTLYLDEARQDNEGNEFCMHNKKSLALDIRTEKGREAFHRLVKESHAVINNFRGSLPDKLGVTYEHLKTYNPGIVCTHLSAYGRDNERAGWPGYDFLMQAETGWMSVTGDPGSPPVKVGVSVVDLMGSVYGALCTVSSLLRVERTGQGCDSDTNLFDIALNCLAYQALWYLNDGILEGKQPRSAHTTQAPSQIYRTADGWIYVACLSQKFWEILCGEIDHEELLDDQRFMTNAERRKNRDILTEVLDGIFSSQSTSYWCEKLQGLVPAAPVYDVKEALDSDYLKRSRKIVTIPYQDNPSRQEVHFLAPPFSFKGIPGVEYACAARLSEHTAEILKSLGYGDEEIAAMRKDKVII
jgi:succinate---hydroxymethylglutarate CoA-transferase